MITVYAIADYSKKIKKGSFSAARCFGTQITPEGQKVLPEGLLANNLTSLDEARALVRVIKEYQKIEGIGGYSYKIRARGPRRAHAFSYPRQYDQDLPLSLGVTFSVYRHANYDYFKRRKISQVWTFWRNLGVDA
jgi:hypothetical protein